ATTQLVVLGPPDRTVHRREASLHVAPVPATQPPFGRRPAARRRARQLLGPAVRHGVLLLSLWAERDTTLRRDADTGDGLRGGLPPEEGALERVQEDVADLARVDELVEPESARGPVRRLELHVAQPRRFVLVG